MYYITFFSPKVQGIFFVLTGYIDNLHLDISEYFSKLYIESYSVIIFLIPLCIKHPEVIHTIHKKQRTVETVRCESVRKLKLFLCSQVVIHFILHFVSDVYWVVTLVWMNTAAAQVSNLFFVLIQAFQTVSQTQSCFQVMDSVSHVVHIFEA